MTAPKERIKNEQEVNKIIKANLPQELSQYFLFDAMQSSELLKKNVFAQTIRDNFENVLGFKKYLQLKRPPRNCNRNGRSFDCKPNRRLPSIMNLLAKRKN